MVSRGIPPESLIPEVRRSSLDELSAWTEESEKEVSFEAVLFRRGSIARAL